MKFFKFLFSGAFMGMLMIAFATAIGYATFVENDYDAITARIAVYNAPWFEMLIALMVVNFLGMIYTKRLYRKSKVNILAIHVALVIIILGAGITRYFGYEGVMHIRNGETSNLFLTSDNYLTIKELESEDYLEQKTLLISDHSMNHYSGQLRVDEQPISVKLSNYYPQAMKKLVKSNNGSPKINLIVGGSEARHDVILSEGESQEFAFFGISFGDSTDHQFIQIMAIDSSLWIRMPNRWAMMSPDSITSERLSKFEPLEVGEVQSFMHTKFMVSEFLQKGDVGYVPSDQRFSTRAFKLLVNDQHVFCGYNEPKLATVNGKKLEFFIGQKVIELPFSIKLNRFNLERYPGSMSPSSFESDVVLIDDRVGIEEPHKIFMNNVLSYEGYRFYQSSYDQDEQGTVLSVNHDFWGTRVTYFGYFLLFSTMILTFFTKGTRFRKTLEVLKETHEKRQKLFATVFILLGLLFGSVQAQTVSSDHARGFGKLLVQGQDGRMMPVNTLANQIMIKVHKRSTFEEMNAEQALLSMMMEPQQWMSVPFVKVNHDEVKKKLGITADYASYADFFERDGHYKLQDAAQTALNKKPALKNQFDKEVIKVNERMDIYYSLINGSMLKLLPLPNDSNNTWTTPKSYERLAGSNPEMKEDIFSNYLAELATAVQSGDYSNADTKLLQLSEYQQNVGSEIVPNPNKVKLEVFYNSANIFKRLFPVYLLIGVFLVGLFFIEILKPTLQFKTISKVFLGIIAVAFALHTLGLIIRWYVSGHAPWSNGYESMIYISWATVLAGFLFFKKSPITLGLTATLAGITLLTAHMSWMDPEITNLVPVLKSYWLTIHVAAITASYGFLGLSAFIGFFNLCLMPFRNKSNQERINLMIKELTLIIELSLMCGLTLLVIGNFLGAIWANESWGRYWGWDPKETWTLVTVMFYSFVLHMNLIPKLKSPFLFNFLSLIGLSTVLMTYFGVNFYLSGLHSYAGGDPVPVPTFVYYVIIIIGIVAGFASFNERMMNSQQLIEEDENINEEKELVEA